MVIFAPCLQKCCARNLPPLRAIQTKPAPHLLNITQKMTMAKGLVTTLVRSMCDFELWPWRFGDLDLWLDSKFEWPSPSVRFHRSSGFDFRLCALIECPWPLDPHRLNVLDLWLIAIEHEFKLGWLCGMDKGYEDPTVLERLTTEVVPDIGSVTTLPLICMPSFSNLPQLYSKRCECL